MAFTSKFLLQGASQPVTMDGYALSADGNKLLISTQTDPIYRRSSKATY